MNEIVQVNSSTQWFDCAAIALTLKHGGLIPNLKPNLRLTTLIVCHVSALHTLINKQSLILFSTDAYYLS